jgi:hypothetical protein
MTSKTSNKKIKLEAKFFKKEFKLRKQYNETLYELIKVLFEEQTSNIASIRQKMKVRTGSLGDS